MTDQTAAIDASPPGGFLHRPQIAVLAGLAATGTLATNILLPSLPQMAVSLKVSSAAVTSAITIFLAVSRWASSWSGRSRTATAAAGRC
jgi:DHA1 family bicyclomycin/chloramphenicol resistance-like MFS transporter